MEGRHDWSESRVPSMTARKHWGRYALGMLTETLFILALTGVGFVLAMIAVVIWG